MTAYILLVMIFARGGNMISMQEFSSEAACKSMGALIWEKAKYNGVQDENITLSCKPK